jgi:biotin carboxylase
MKRKVILLGASKTNFLSIEEFSKQNHTQIIVVDGNKENVARIKRRLNCQAFYYDIKNDREQIYKLALKKKISGIFSFNDHGLKTASYISQKLNLHGISMASTLASLDKGVMRDVWRHSDITQPEFSIIKKENEVLDFVNKVGFPIVIKPTDCGGGGRGVYVITSQVEIKVGYEFAKKVSSNNDRLIVEKFIYGIETSVEVVYINGNLNLIAYSEKDKPNVNTRVATHIFYPGKFNKTILSKIEDTSKSIMESLGLHNWMGHIEFIINNEEEVYAIEIGARVGGGHTFHPIASHVAGFSYPQLILKIINRQYENIPVAKNSGSACYSFITTTDSGLFKNIKIYEPTGKTELNIFSEVLKNKDDYIGGLDDSMQRLGCVVTLGNESDDIVSLNKSIVEKSIVNLKNA